MADKVQFQTSTGQTCYFFVWRQADDYAWNTAGTPAFESYNVANIADYDTAATEVGATGVYSGDFPSGITDGTIVNIDCRIRSGATPAASDVSVAFGTFRWIDGKLMAADAVANERVRVIDSSGNAASYVATGGVTVNNTILGAITSSSFMDGAITAASIASNAITAAKIATGAIDADALATDAVNEIVDAVWDEATSGHATAGTTGAALTSIADVPTVDEIWAEAPGNIPLNINRPFVGNHIDVFRLDAWESSMGSGRTLSITFESGEAWPDTLNESHFYAKPTDATLDANSSAASLSDVACVVDTATGSGRKVTINLTSTQIGTLHPGNAGGYRWWVVANKSTKRATLRAGAMTVREDYAS